MDRARQEEIKQHLQEGKSIRASRDELKEVFHNENSEWAILNEGFPLYIDSKINIRDDQINLEGQKGMVLYTHGPNQQLLGFQDPSSSPDSLQADYQIRFGRGGENEPASLQVHGKIADLGLHLSPEGRVGMGTDTPSTLLEVEGVVAADEWIGTYAEGHIPADGKWHATQVQGLMENVHAFEVVAHVNDERDERYALTVGTVMIEISRRKARFHIDLDQVGSKWIWGRRWNYIHFRWAQTEQSKVGSNNMSCRYVRARITTWMSRMNPNKYIIACRKLAICKLTLSTPIPFVYLSHTRKRVFQSLE